MSASNIVMNCDDLRNIIFSYAFPEIPKMPDGCQCNDKFYYKWFNECEYLFADDKPLKLYLIKDIDNNYKYFCNACRINTMMDFINYPNSWYYGLSIVEFFYYTIEKVKPNWNEKQITRYIKRNERLFYDDDDKKYYHKKTKQTQILFKQILCREYKNIIFKLLDC